MIRPTHTEKKFTANREFTDRDDAKALFMEACEAAQPADSYHVLMWYGVGGQGKSALARECERILHRLREAAPNMPNPRRYAVAKVDFEDARLRRIDEALLSLRLQLSKTSGMSFGAFDTAFARYFTLTNPGVDMRKRHPELFRGENELLNDLLDWSEVGVEAVAEAASLAVPGMNILYKYGARLTGKVRQWWDMRGKQVLRGLDDLHPDEIAENLPSYLGADICYAIAADETLRPVILLDTYEALWRERGQKDGDAARRADQWVRLLVQDAPGVLFCLFGRDKLRWPQFDPEWADVIDDHLLGGLSDEDAECFLRKVPIEDGDIRANIVSGAKGLPFFLDLQVDLYEAIMESDRDPVADDFGGSHPDILNRFLDHLSEAEENVLRLASYPLVLDEAGLCELADIHLGGGAHVNWRRMTGRSFFSEGDDGTMTLHVLMREDLQKREKDERPELFKAIHTSLFDLHNSGIAPEAGRWVNTGNERAFSNAFHHLSESDEVAAVSWVLEQAGPFQKAARWALLETIYRRALGVSRRVLGEEHPDTLTMRSSLALQTYHQGRYAEAEAEFRTVWDIRRRSDVLGEEHPSTLEARHELALQIGAQGSYAEAEAEFRAIWDIQRRPDVLGEEHPDTLTTRHNLAHRIGHRGRYAEAEAEFRAVWDIQRRPDVLGEEHPNTLTTRLNLAQQIGNQGRYAEAEAEFRAIWDIQRRPDVLGEEHPSTLATRHNLAQQIGDQGRYAEAEAELRAIWDIRRRPDVLGEEHPNTLTTRHNLALQIGNQGRYAEAEAEFRAIWDIRRRPDVLGEEHSHCLRAKFLLAKMLDGQDRSEEAATLLDGLRDGLTSTLRPGHKWIVELDDYLATRE